MKKLIVTNFIVFMMVSGNVNFANSKEDKPWLEPMNPSKLEWLALQKQADEGDTEFGENGLTVNFYLGPKSDDAGIVYCDIDYLSSVKAELIQKLEEGIKRRFNKMTKLYPWAKVVITKNVVR